MIDLLAQLYEGKIDLDHAYDILEGNRKWISDLGFSEFESRASLHAAGLDDLVIFRYQGWPTTCANCQLPLDYKVDYWWFTPDKDEKPCLVHIHCLAEWSKKEKSWKLAETDIEEGESTD